MIDLALLQPEWQVVQSQIVLTTNPQQVLPPNARRYALLFSYVNNQSPPDAQKNVCFLTINSNALQFGRPLTAIDSIRFNFPSEAALVQSEWWARDSGTNPTAGGVLTMIQVIQSIYYSSKKK